MRIDLILVPYHLGRPRVSMGKGPEHLLKNRARFILEQGNHEVVSATLELETAFCHEVGATFELARLLSARVKTAVGDGRFPLVLAGNCNSALGILSGLRSDELGVVWFDAHGEFNTPDTTRTGFLDGMPLTMATGRSWKTLCESIPGFRPIAEDRILLVGARALDPAERDLLDSSGVRRVSPEEIKMRGVRRAMTPHLDALATRAREVYLHLDLDVLDPSEARVSEYAEPGGLAVEEVEEACRLVAGRFGVRAVTVASYDPDWDEGGKGAQAALRLMGSLADALEGSSGNDE